MLLGEGHVPIVTTVFLEGTSYASHSAGRKGAEGLSHPRPFRPPPPRLVRPTLSFLPPTSDLAG